MPPDRRSRLGAAMRGAFSFAENLNRAVIYRRKVRGKLRTLGLPASAPDDACAYLPGYRDGAWRRCCHALRGWASPHDVSEELFYNAIEPFLNPPDRIGPYLDKNFYDRLDLPWRLPRVVGRIIRGRFLDGGYAPADPRKAFADLGEVVVKPALGRQHGGGKNLRFLSPADAAAFAASAPQADPAAEWVFQAPIDQSPELARLNPGSVNTLRPVTLLGPDGPRLLSAFLRMGRAGGRVDDSRSPTGGVTVGVIDGRLGPFALDAASQRHERHPDSGVRFEGMALSGWDAAVEAVLALHRRIPEIGMISWDVAFDADDRPVIIEMNLSSQGIMGHQYLNGPLFGEAVETLARAARPRLLFGYVVG